MSEFITAGTVAFRTRLMDAARATRFAACLSANARFAAVAVVKSFRAKGDADHFVQFQPASDERKSALLDRQQRDREVRAYQQGSGYLWCRENGFNWCLSTSGEVYEVTEHSCDCPDHRYRSGPAGIPCKHMLALRNGLGTVVHPEVIPSAPADDRQQEARRALAATFGG